MTQLWWTAALLAVLAGCAAPGEEAAILPEPPERQSTPGEPLAPETVLVPELESQPELPPEPDPEPAEPERELRPGPAVLLDGVLLPGGTVLWEGAAYLPLETVSQALEAQADWPKEADGGTLSWRGKEARLALRASAAQIDGRYVPLSGRPFREGETIYVPLDVVDALGYGRLEDPERGCIYLTAAAGVWDIPEGHSVPILMYHGVTDQLWGMTDLFVSPSSLDQQLTWLEENGWTTIWFEDLPRLEEIEKPVILTFDDGYADNYHELLPILQTHQAKATVFVSTGAVDVQERTLTSSQIEELDRSGLVSIQSHGIYHLHMAQESQETQVEELTWSQLFLARLTGKVPFVFCYPFGSASQLTRDLTAEHYRFGLDMTGNRDYVTGTDPYAVERYYIARSTTLQAFAQMLGS